jgi:hypothetical protein
MASNTNGIELEQELLINNVMTMKYNIAKEQLKNIRAQQSFERTMDVFGSLSRFCILYILPVLLSGSIGYRVHHLGTSAKLVIVKGFMTIPIIAVELLTHIYTTVLSIANLSVMSYLSFGYYNPTHNPNNVTNAVNSNSSFLQTKLTQMDTNVDEISQHSVDLVVTLLTIFLYISFLSLMHFLIKWEEISRFHIGWTNMIIEIKERNQTTKYEIEELMKMLNAVPMINHRQAIQMNTEPLAIETESPNAPDLSSNEESESNNEPSPSPSPSPTPPVTRSRYNR